MAVVSGFRTKVPVFAVLFVGWYYIMFRWQSGWWRSGPRSDGRAFFQEREDVWPYNVITRNLHFNLACTYYSILPGFLAAMLAVTLGSKAPWLSYRLKVPLTGFYWMLILYVVMQVAWVFTREWRDGERKQTPGFMAMFNMQLILIPISRTSPLLRWFKLDPADALAYHRQLGWIMTILVLIHAGWYCIHWINEEGFAGMFRHVYSWEGKYPTFPGTCALICGMFMALTALEPIRRKYYQVFFQVHRVAGILIFVFFSAHYPSGFWMVLCNVLIYVSDRATEMRGWIKPVPIRSARYGAGVLTIRLPAAEKPAPCQWVQVQAPKISLLEMHPFSVAATDQDSMILCLKVNPGSWTDRLVQDIFERKTKTLRVSDLYGSSFELENYGDEPVCMFAGGSGITSFSALLQHFSRIGGLKENATGRDNPVILNWVCKNKPELQELMLGVQLEETLKASPNLTVNLYVTGANKIAESGSMKVNYEEKALKRPPRWVLEWLCHLCVPLGAILIGGWATHSDEAKANDPSNHLYVSLLVLAGALVGAVVAHILSGVLGRFCNPTSMDEPLEMGAGGEALVFSGRDDATIASEAGQRLIWHRNRPDFGRIMEDMVGKCGVRKLLVLSSGPPGMNAAVSEAAESRGHAYEEFTFEM